MWHTLRFCNSQVYIARVHGLVKRLCFDVEHPLQIRVADERLDPIAGY
jgi:hypothetical protein